VKVVNVLCGSQNNCRHSLFLIIDMSVFKEPDAEKKSGVAVIKAEYVFMALNLLKYDFNVAE
jgi:hypothetical protein